MNPTAAANTRARNPVPESVDVAVIGAGLGGLVTAAQLARAGQRVAVFESHYVAGGCATMFTRRGEGGRYHFDVGLHYIGDCGPGGMIPRILGELGIELAYEPLDPDGFDTLIFPDFRFKIPANRDQYRDRLVDLFPAERKSIDAYVRLLTEVEYLVKRMERSPGGKPGLGMLWDVARHGRLGALYQGRTIGQFFDDHVRDPKLRAVMLGQSGDYGLPPSKVSAMLHVGLANHYFAGAYYPVGGGQVIADRLAAYIEAHGGSVHLRTPVERITTRDGKATGVRVQPRNAPAVDVKARAVVSNADLKRTLLELIDPADLPSDVAAKARGYEMAAALFMTFLGVRGDLRARGLTNTNYWSFDGYDFEQFYAAGEREGPAAIKGSYITSGSLKDPATPTHAPPGMSTVEIMAIVPGRMDIWGTREAEVGGWAYKKSPAYLDLKQRIEDALIARFDRLCPGAAADIVYRESATPVTHARFTGASGGTGYGLAATPEQFLNNRPGYRGPLGGLYLCGASTRAGHGIVGAMMSGQAAAKRVVKDLSGR